MAPIAEWLAANPSKIARKFPEDITHISAWVEWTFKTESEKPFRELVDDILTQLGQHLDPDFKGPTRQWVKNLYLHLLTDKNSFQCPVDKKFVGRLVDERHGEKCLRNSLNPALVY